MSCASSSSIKRKLKEKKYKKRNINNKKRKMLVLIHIITFVPIARPLHDLVKKGSEVGVDREVGEGV